VNLQFLRGNVHHRTFVSIILSLATRQINRGSFHLQAFWSRLLVSAENNGPTIPKWLTTNGLDAQFKNISSFLVKSCDWWRKLSILLSGYWFSDR
jgi:hypothetical protein